MQPRERVVRDTKGGSRPSRSRHACACADEPHSNPTASLAGRGCGLSPRSSAPHSMRGTADRPSRAAFGRRCSAGRAESWRLREGDRRPHILLRRWCCWEERLQLRLIDGSRRLRLHRDLDRVRLAHGSIRPPHGAVVIDLERAA
eukprot:3409601-Prymnesium_polylepis.2